MHGTEQNNGGKSPKQCVRRVNKMNLCGRKNGCTPPVIGRRRENNTKPCMREMVKTKTMSGRVGRVVIISLPPNDVKRKSPLVEWERGQGLTVLPHPPLLNNNCPS